MMGIGLKPVISVVSYPSGNGEQEGELIVIRSGKGSVEQ